MAVSPQQIVATVANGVQHCSSNRSLAPSCPGWTGELMRADLVDSLHIVTGELRHAAFVDQMQKVFRGHLGFLYSSSIEKKISNGDLLIAEDDNGIPFAMCLGTKSYDRNDQVSRIDQLAVVPMKQRRQVGGALLAEWIRRLPYGVKLICCWCAQDLRENRFWEAQGFLPLAFRAGGQSMNRMHIFWQRRCRTGDISTPWWYPKETSNGAMAASRLILPVPPGQDWRELDLPRIVPEAQQAAGSNVLPNGLPAPAALPGRGSRTTPAGSAAPMKTPAQYAAEQRAKSKLLQERRPPGVKVAGRYVAEQPPPPPPKAEKPKKKRPKNTPEHVEAARELRDRYLERLSDAQIVEQGRYDPSRCIDDAPASPAVQRLMERINGQPADRQLERGE